MVAATPRYEGLPELEVLEYATRYARHIAKLFAAALPETRHPRVVDFGAGLGTISREFHLATGVRPVAVEPDASLRDRLSREGFEAVESLDSIAPASIDLIVSSNVLEHIEDDVGALRAMRARLRRGGRIALWVPAFPFLWTTLDDRVGHIRRYRRADLRAAVESAGLRVSSVAYQDSLGFVAATAYKWLRPRSAALDLRSVRIYDRWLFPLSARLDSALGGRIGKNLLLLAERA